ncbi:preprotein translocase subunit SecE [Saccharomonospora xinjiangensis]|uniref:preprotein translocase subunit SecE n=1 Tax=Saccharomonospora xinjiangensis TaxID=75294 RepID=UPI0010706770|nr:preprotein translocase subunit SecE [Saccharomonospora xinjiangensis]QBQ58803.1 preprotein translocase subunit SecE [Saccharomonospora xinjiangensis]
MSEDGEKDKERAERPSRPDTAAARRARRASADRKDTPAKAGTGAGAGRSTESTKRPSPKGKTSEKVAKPEGKGAPTPKRNRRDAKKGSLFTRIGRFIREVWGELRKVIWPTRKQMVTYTTVVLFFLVFMVALVAGLDFVFLEGVDVVFGD